jgi:tRNA(His) 5'-end guanylyltransferase
MKGEGTHTPIDTAPKGSTTGTTTTTTTNRSSTRTNESTCTTTDINTSTTATATATATATITNPANDNISSNKQCSSSMSRKAQRKKQSDAILEDGKVTLSSLSEYIQHRLKSNDPLSIIGDDNEGCNNDNGNGNGNGNNNSDHEKKQKQLLHYIPPHIPRGTWDALGTLVAKREQEPISTEHKNNMMIDGSKWFSLRLDGKNFSQVTKKLRRENILESKHGYSDRFASCMQRCCKGLMEKFNARIGYTQSDEMIVFVPPTNMVKGCENEHQGHIYNGRVSKLTTLASGYVSATFISYLTHLCIQSIDDNHDDDGVAADGVAKYVEKVKHITETLLEVVPYFDCRLGYYENWEEARALLLWRAYDCSINGVSDAIHHDADSSTKRENSLNAYGKINWLRIRDKLPLPRHQAYGTYMKRRKRQGEGYNPKTKESVPTYRNVIEIESLPVLEIARNGELQPDADDNIIF